MLIGTQDMLLSRAMNRGYASPRARWPMEFGLLNQDCLWVMDEVQLMDVWLATSAQLQAFRSADDAAGRGLRPCHTWWMSATLQPDWLTRSPDTTDMAGTLAPVTIPAPGRTGRLWEDVQKPSSLRLSRRNIHSFCPSMGPELKSSGNCYDKEWRNKLLSSFNGAGYKKSGNYKPHFGDNIKSDQTAQWGRNKL